MAMHQDNASSIGNTPLVRLNRIVSPKASVYAKIEGRNPAYSIKCRLGSALIWDAEKRGLLKPGGTLVEPTSGNTGIALAAVAAARGYRAVIAMPETMSLERRKVMAMFGAEIILTPGASGMAGAIERAEAFAKEEGAYMPRQFENMVGPQIHAQTTGPEIWADTGGEIAALVAGVGTGGTITGCGQFLKAKNPALILAAVEPAASPVIKQTLAGETPKPAPHPIQGIGAGFIPKILDLSLIDRVEGVEGEEALEFARRLAREEGILAGISSGAATAAAARLSALPEFQTIVVILPDAGERYLSSKLFEGIGE